MPSYTTLGVLALVASNLSPALSAPIPQIREKSLDRRVNWGAAFKKHGKEFALGMGATMAFGWAFEKLAGKNTAKEGTAVAESAAGSGTASGAANTAETASTATTANNQVYSGYPSSTDTGYSSSTYPSYSSSTNPSYSSSTNPSYSSSTNPVYSSSTNPVYSPPTSPIYSPSMNPTPGGYQQRAVDRDLPVDIFEAGSTSGNKNQNRQAASADLLGRADLVEAIRLFSRMLDELD